MSFAGGGGSSARAKEPPKAEAPAREHEWLKQLAGEWDSKIEATMEPGKPPLKCEGTEFARAVGGFWIVAEHRNVVMGQPMTGVMTVGYDPEKKKYIGTWVDSGSHHLWRYEGTVDAAGKTLTLEAEGPNPMAQGKMAKFRDSVEVKDKDHKVLRSAIQTDDGKWVTFMTGNYTRKK